MLAALPVTLLTRSTLMLTQLVLITKKYFKLKCGRTYTALRDCVVRLLGESQKQALQVSGIQLAIAIYQEDQGEVDVLFKHLMMALDKSKFKESRRKIIKMLKMPKVVKLNMAH